MSWDDTVSVGVSKHACIVLVKLATYTATGLDKPAIPDSNDPNAAWPHQIP